MACATPPAGCWPSGRGDPRRRLGLRPGRPAPGWNWHDGNPFDLGWIVFYSCWGAAALHPSMRELSEPPAGGAAAHEPVPAGSARRGHPHRPRRAARRDGGWASRSTPRSSPASPGSCSCSSCCACPASSRAHKQAVAREQVLRREAAELVARPAGRASTRPRARP